MDQTDHVKSYTSTIDIQGVQVGPSSNRTAKLDLFLASFLALFMEVMLIRWVPSYERLLAYFTNFVLIGAFLGLGLGTLLARRQRDLMRYQSVLVLFLVTVVILFHQYVDTRGIFGEAHIGESGGSALIKLKLPYCLVFFFLLISLQFVALGQRIGKDFRSVGSPLHGYILNILGSLLGVVLFSLMSALQLSPWWWFATAGGLLCWFVRMERAWLTIGLVAGVLTVVAVWSVGSQFIWSPYHKIQVSSLVVDGSGMLRPFKKGIPTESVTSLPLSIGFHVAVDDDFLQMALDLSSASVYGNPILRNYRKHYDLPYSIQGFTYDDVLIVGAGTGNDTAAALRHGVRHVDAIEIDPALVELGRGAHPEQPYDDSKVRVVVDDARSYFNKSGRKYDLVVFGLLDSHRLFSSMSSVRLDSFVYTLESFREVRQLLKDDGIVVVQHGVGTEFMRRRMYFMLAQAFGMVPLVAEVPELGGLTFVIGPGVAKFIGPTDSGRVERVDPALDDWPFFYLAGRRLPREYIWALGAMLVISVVSLLGCSAGRMRTVKPHFFFLGSAFLLIETLSVTRFALLFGSTWIVNSIVFSAILVVVLLANLLMTRVESVNIHVLYALLGLSVLLNFWFPMHMLLRTELAVRLAASMGLMASPVFFAAFIFARSFKQTTDPDLAFASNLLGAVVGGLIEYSTLVIGFRHQLLIALALYGFSYAAWVIGRRQPVAAPA